MGLPMLRFPVLIRRWPLDLSPYLLSIPSRYSRACMEPRSYSLMPFGPSSANKGSTGVWLGRDRA